MVCTEQLRLIVGNLRVDGPRLEPGNQILMGHGRSEAISRQVDQVDLVPGLPSPANGGDRDRGISAGLMTVRVALHTRTENAVALTKAGTALVRKGDALFEQSRAAMLAATDPGDLTVAVTVLQGLLEAL